MITRAQLPRPYGATPRPRVKRAGVALRLIVKNMTGANYLTGTDYLLEMWTSDTVRGDGGAAWSGAISASSTVLT